MAGARHAVVQALIKMDESEGYSNLVLNDILGSAQLDKREGAFAAALFYGVIERKITLDYILKGHSKLPLKKVDLAVLNILRMGIYQLLYMDSVPDSAAVNESVLLCKKCRKSSAGGFVNAVLHAVIREGKKVSYPEKGSDLGRLSVEYSCPEPLISLFIQRFGKEHAQGMLKKSIGAAPLYARVNTTKTTTEELLTLLQAEGVSAQKHEDIPNCISLYHTGDIEHLHAYEKGLFHIQDGSSQLCSMALGAEAGMTVLDLCAAPGGKSFTIAQQMGNTGKLLAFDLYDFKANLIQKGAQRLGLSNVTAQVSDAAEYNPALPIADRVLCDAPCSGFGIIRRKPEIKYKELDEFDELQELQLKILQNGARYVAPGGILLYSTCTLRQQENEDIAEEFLKQDESFAAYPLPDIFKKCLKKQSNMATILPDIFDTDGFFLATFQKVN